MLRGAGSAAFAEPEGDRVHEAQRLLDG